MPSRTRDLSSGTEQKGHVCIDQSIRPRSLTHEVLRYKDVRSPLKYGEGRCELMLTLLKLLLLSSCLSSFVEVQSQDCEYDNDSHRDDRYRNSHCRLARPQVSSRTWITGSGRRGLTLMSSRLID